jgi:hypothetical protein
MKKAILLSTFTAGSLLAVAQPVTLSGTSYTQDFSSLGAATPTTPSGWYGYNGATSSSPGTLATIKTSKTYGVFADTVQSSSCMSSVLNEDFKNFASANLPSAKTATCSEQATITDRALGVRQKSGTPWDPGASFVFKIANTLGRTGFNLTFKLQSLDTTSPRTTTWAVEYGLGTTPTAFTAASSVSGTLTTGNYTFSNNTVTASFGSALDNQSGNVWIRIVSLMPTTTGPGNRTSSAIDDFNLTWTGTGVSVEEVNKQTAATIAVFGEAATDRIVLGYNVAEQGKYEVAIHDISGRQVNTVSLQTNEAGTQTIDGLNLVPGFYVVRMSNGTTNAVTRFAVH